MTELAELPHVPHSLSKDLANHSTEFRLRMNGKEALIDYKKLCVNTHVETEGLDFIQLLAPGGLDYNQIAPILGL